MSLYGAMCWVGGWELRALGITFLSFGFVDNLLSSDGVHCLVLNEFWFMAAEFSVDACWFQDECCLDFSLEVFWQVQTVTPLAF